LETSPSFRLILHWKRLTLDFRGRLAYDGVRSQYRLTTPATAKPAVAGDPGAARGL
jgi:hypothetical protein